MSIVIMKALMVFHEEWKFILFNSAGCPTMNTYKLLIYLIQCILERMYCLLQVKNHKAMVYNGGIYRIKKLDETKKTSDSGVSAVFEVTNVLSRNDRHPKV